MLVERPGVAVTGLPFDGAGETTVRSRYMQRLLDACERIIAEARACVATFDFGETLDKLLALEGETGAHE